MSLKVEIVSRIGGLAWEGEATSVTVPLVDGEMGILTGHTPMLALVGKGIVRATPTDGGTVVVPVEGGFFSVDHNVVTIAVDEAGHEVRVPEGVDPQSALAAMNS